MPGKLGLTVSEQISRNAANRGRGLAVRVIDPITGYIVKAANLFNAPAALRRLIPASNIEIRTPLGLPMDSSAIMLTPQEIEAKAAEMDALFEVADPRRCRIAVPEMFEFRELLFTVAKDVASGGQMAALVESGYEIAGHNADKLSALIADKANAAAAIDHLSFEDAIALRDELNRQNPGAKFRIPTDEEFKLLAKYVKEVPWAELWVWVDTMQSGGDYALRRLEGVFQSTQGPAEGRYPRRTVLLIRDK